VAVAPEVSSAEQPESVVQAVPLTRRVLVTDPDVRLGAALLIAVIVVA
jgi:hypothetical protein